MTSSDSAARLNDVITKLFLEALNEDKTTENISADRFLLEKEEEEMPFFPRIIVNIGGVWFL